MKYPKSFDYLLNFALSILGFLLFDIGMFRIGESFA